MKISRIRLVKALVLTNPMPITPHRPVAYDSLPAKYHAVRPISLASKANAALLELLRVTFIRSLRISGHDVHVTPEHQDMLAFQALTVLSWVLPASFVALEGPTPLKSRVIQRRCAMPTTPSKIET